MRTLPPLPDDVRPDEVIAALAPVLGPERMARLDAIAEGRLLGVAAILDDLRDPHNAAAALRSCEAMGVLRVHVISVRQRFRTSTRVTQGCERWLDVARHGGVDSCVHAVKAAGYRIYAAMPGAPRTLAELDPAEPIALAFGNEHAGLSPGLRERCDGAFAIPMYGASQSLNVSVSLAIALHVATEARRGHVGRRGDLAPDELQRLRARYCYSDLRGARAIIERARMIER